jgi:hypothetical protein
MEGIIDKENERVRRFFALLDDMEKKVEGKRKPKQVWIHYPLWVCERNVVVKEKTPFHTWMRQCRKSGNKKCGFSIRVNAMITDFFLFLYHQVGYLQVNNLSNL